MHKEISSIVLVDKKDRNTECWVQYFFWGGVCWFQGEATKGLETEEQRRTKFRVEVLNTIRRHMFFLFDPQQL